MVDTSTGNHEAASQDARTPSPAVAQKGAVRLRAMRVLGVVVVLGLVVLAAQTADRATVTDVLSIPDTGSIRADRLANGTPVFIISTPPTEEGGDPVLDVIQAFDTEVTDPITGLVGWCADAVMFVDPHFGPQYDVRGRRLPSSLRGRSPAADLYAQHNAVDDLIHRQVDGIEGRTQPDDPVVVGPIQDLQPWQVQDRPFMEPRTAPEPCRIPNLPPVPDPDAPDAFRRLIDHSFLAEPINPEESGWQITDGWLIIDAQGEGTWCDVEPSRGLDPRCAEPRPQIGVAFSIDAEDMGGVPAVVGGPLAVRLEEGAVARAAVMADSTWRGSSFRGTERYEGQLGSSWTFRRQSIGVRGMVGGGEESCVRAFPGVLTAQITEAKVPVSDQTIFDVAGITDAEGLDQLPLGRDGPQVEVVIDRVTCDALVVRDAA